MVEHTEYEVVLLQLAPPNLLLHRIPADINIHVHFFGLENPLDFLHIVIHGRHHRDDEDLSGAEPEWPFPCEVLDQDTNETFKAADDRAVHHDRSCAARSRV